MERHQPGDNEVRLTLAQASELGERALQSIGYNEEESRVICAHLVDASACGYPFAGLPRILTIAEHPSTRRPRKPVSITHETEVSALLDGGNYVGYYAVHQAAKVAIAKARKNGFALVGMYNSQLSGRNSYYMEMIAREDLIGIHTSSASLVVAPLGGTKPALGTNPFCIGVPSERGPVIYDIGTASIMLGELILRSRLNEELPPGVAVDSQGRPTVDPHAALQGAILPFAGHKGYGLSFIIQALGLLAGASLVPGKVPDYAFLFIVFDPGLLVPVDEFKREVDELIARVKATPKQPGVDEIRIPSERAFRERDQARKEGILVDRKMVESLQALAASPGSTGKH
jgi:LDH2 family malate/lactate/ureidoglycolate dehydrogenase